jgi:hypothetical protein
MAELQTSNYIIPYRFIHPSPSLSCHHPSIDNTHKHQAAKGSLLNQIILLNRIVAVLTTRPLPNAFRTMDPPLSSANDRIFYSGPASWRNNSMYSLYTQQIMLASFYATVLCPGISIHNPRQVGQTWFVCEFVKFIRPSFATLCNSLPYTHKHTDIYGFITKIWSIKLSLLHVLLIYFSEYIIYSITVTQYVHKFVSIFLFFKLTHA